MVKQWADEKNKQTKKEVMGLDYHISTSSGSFCMNIAIGAIKKYFLHLKNKSLSQVTFLLYIKYLTFDS